MIAEGRPRDSVVRYDPPFDLGAVAETSVLKGGKPTLKSQLAKKTALPKVDGKPQLDDILHALLPPREWVEHGKHFIQYVSNQSATRLDVIQLQETLDQTLMERQARETGICPVREELYAQCFDELIRQITVNSPERGLLLLRVRDEVRMSIAAYQTLYASSVTFGTRKHLQSEQGKQEMENMINELEDKKRSLEGQAVEWRNQFHTIEKREAEKRAIEEKKNKDEIEFLKHQGQQLESFLASVERSG